MIFDTNYSRYNDNVNPSPYELNMEGALMHVYETELNYNAIMKSVGVSELRYYNDTGKDLFVNEAGAFKRFIDAIVKFFKNIIEKIKAIFQKFLNLFRKKSKSDKEFVKEFEKVYNAPGGGGSSKAALPGGTNRAALPAGDMSKGASSTGGSRKRTSSTGGSSKSAPSVIYTDRGASSSTGSSSKAALPGGTNRAALPGGTNRAALPANASKKPDFGSTRMTDFIPSLKIEKNTKHNGYTFEGLDDYIDKFSSGSIIDVNSVLKDTKFDAFGTAARDAIHRQSAASSLKNEEYKNKKINLFRSELLEESPGEEYTLEEFKNKLHEKCYGEKREFEFNIQEQLDYIKNTENYISRVEKVKNTIIRNIDDVIKVLERIDKENEKVDNDDATKEQNHKKYLQQIDVYKANSQDIMVAFGTITAAVRDRNVQARSICTSYISKISMIEKKNESFIYDDNIFSNVCII